MHDTHVCMHSVWHSTSCVSIPTNDSAHLLLLDCNSTVQHQALFIAGCFIGKRPVYGDTCDIWHHRIHRLRFTDPDLALQMPDLGFTFVALLHHVLEVRIAGPAVVLPIAQHIHGLVQLLLKPGLPAQQQL